MSDTTDPIALRPRLVPVEGTQASEPQPAPQPRQASIPPRATFTRQELNIILNVYGRQVAAGEWRDYAMDFTKDRAVFSVYRRASEMPIYRIEKTPKLARKQGAYSIVTQTGLILKRGHDLRRVLAAVDKRVRLVD